MHNIHYIFTHRHNATTKLTFRSQVHLILIDDIYVFASNLTFYSFDIPQRTHNQREPLAQNLCSLRRSKSVFIHRWFDRVYILDRLCPRHFCVPGTRHGEQLSDFDLERAAHVDLSRANSERAVRSRSWHPPNFGLGHDADRFAGRWLARNIRPQDAVLGRRWIWRARRGGVN